MSDDLKAHLKVVAGVAIAFGVVLLLPLAVGIWLPDIPGSPRRTLAEARSANGEVARVIQYWNNGDFYNTEFEFLGTNGIVTSCVIDPDDSKSWSVPMTVDWAGKKGTVTLGGGRLKNVSWGAGEAFCEW